MKISHGILVHGRHVWYYINDSDELGTCESKSILFALQEGSQNSTLQSRIEISITQTHRYYIMYSIICALYCIHTAEQRNKVKLKRIMIRTRTRFFSIKWMRMTLIWEYRKPAVTSIESIRIEWKKNHTECCRNNRMKLNFVCVETMTQSIWRFNCTAAAIRYTYTWSRSISLEHIHAKPIII